MLNLLWICEVIIGDYVLAYEFALMVSAIEHFDTIKAGRRGAFFKFINTSDVIKH